MVTIYDNITLKDRNSFHISVSARKLIEWSSVADLKEIFSSPELTSQGWILLSGGNNTLFTTDIEATILTPTAKDIAIIEDGEQRTTIQVSPAAEWDDVVEWCVERGLWGIENLSLIPGMAGAAPVQNIGAYGVELCDSLVRVEYFDTESLTTHTLERDECEFGYRSSIFKGRLKSRAIVTSITLRLSKSANPKIEYADIQARIEQRGGDITPRTIRDVVCEIRREKLPDTEVLGNAGSFFKNPIITSEKAHSIRGLYPNVPLYDIDTDPLLQKIAAGWLIDQVGLKGYRTGAVGVHERQALVLVNYGGATGKEVVALADHIKKMVWEHFEIAIESEVNIL